jgi:hypothetical protein
MELRGSASTEASPGIVRNSSAPEGWNSAWTSCPWLISQRNAGVVRIASPG